MFNHDIWRTPYFNDHEYNWKGKYGAKGEKRKKKKKPTPEQIRENNQRNREKYVQRTIALNFIPKDLWVCCKYPKGIRLPYSEVKRDVNFFLRKLREAYKKKGIPLKYFFRMEVGKEGGIHFHILLNRIWTEQTDLIVEKAWEKALLHSSFAKENPPSRIDGLVDHRSSYEAGGFEGLAKYITKRTEKTEAAEQLSLFEETEQKGLQWVSSSRNLIRPEKERRTYSHWTMRKILENLDKLKNTEGFYIDKSSIQVGINPFTGYSYLRYTEICLSPPGKEGIP